MADKAVSKNIDTILLANIYCDNPVWDFLSSNLTLNSAIKAIFCIGTIKGIGHLWFVGNILLCYLITPCLSYIQKYFCNRDFRFHLFLVVSIICLFTVVGVMTNSHMFLGLSITIELMWVFKKQKNVYDTKVFR